jgi:CRISPR-associated protein Csh2
MISKTDTIENRSEIVFLYDAVDANPNGDPLTEENHPRVDDYTGEAIVTDVRLKRVVRDYIDDQGETILVKASGEGQRDDKNDRYGTVYEEMEPLLDDETDEESAFLSVATDVRLFGDSMAFDESPVDGSYTGPVQFNFGRSMHPVHEVNHGKTSVLAADSEGQTEGNVGGNMYTDHRLAYALMRFHGVVNENAAKDTGLSEGDVALLEDGLWYGTREQTNTSSKRGHEPRLLVRVEYGEEDYHVGDLHRSLSLRTNEDPKSMRDVSDAVVEIDGLLDLLDEHDDRIETIHVRASRRLRVHANGSNGGPALLEDALVERLGTERVRFHDE